MRRPSAFLLYLFSALLPVAGGILLFSSLPYPHNDEYGTWWFTSGTLEQILERTHAQGQAPLYYIIQWFLNHGFSLYSIEQMRITSIVLFAGGFFLLGKLFQDWFGPAAGFAGSVVIFAELTSDLGRIYYLLLLRPYALLWFIMALGLYLQHRSFQRNNFWPLSFYTGLTIALVFIQQLYLFFIPFLLFIRVWSLTLYGKKRMPLDWIAPFLIIATTVASIAIAPTIAPHIVAEAHLISITSPLKLSDYLEILCTTSTTLFFFVCMGIIGSHTIIKEARGFIIKNYLSLLLVLIALPLPLLFLYTFEGFWHASFNHTRYYLYYVFSSGIFVGTLLKSLRNEGFICVVTILFIAVFSYGFYQSAAKRENTTLSLYETSLTPTLQEAAKQLSHQRIEPKTLYTFSHVGFVEEQTKFPIHDPLLQEFLTAPLQYYDITNAIPVPHYCNAATVISLFLDKSLPSNILLIGNQNLTAVASTDTVPCTDSLAREFSVRSCLETWRVENSPNKTEKTVAILMQCLPSSKS